MAKVKREAFLSPDFKDDIIWTCLDNGNHMYSRAHGKQEVLDINMKRLLKEEQIQKLESRECPTCSPSKPY